jgi:hypothetical protein
MKIYFKHSYSLYQITALLYYQLQLQPKLWFMSENGTHRITQLILVYLIAYSNVVPLHIILKSIIIGLKVTSIILASRSL